MKIIINGEPVEVGGASLPPGGTTGQALVKASDADGDVVWSYADEIYSTDETRIGTWVDGKPLYRKTFVATSSQNTVIPFDISSTIRNIYGTIYTRNNTNVSINCFFSSSFYSCAWQDINSSSIQISTHGGSWTESPMIVTVEYTKTADQETTHEVTT